MFYTTENYFREKFDATFRPFAFRADSVEEYTKWKKAFVVLLKDLLGLDKMVYCDPDPESLSVEKMDGYTREKLVISTEPGVKMPFYLLRPDSAKPGEALPLMIAPHGHVSNGKNAVCGIDMNNQAMKDTIAEHNYDYGVQFVKEGFLVLCPDARGFGERAEKYWQKEEHLLDSSCAYLNAMAYPLGLCVTGMWTWDLMRLLDYALTREDVDGSRINCGGLSGGGLQTLWLGVIDERVTNMIISGYFYGYNQSLLEMFNCSCNYIPRLWEYADIGDIGALLANRGVFFETGDIDSLNGKDNLDNVYPHVGIVKEAAKLFDNEDNIVHHVFVGAHKWCGEKSIPWVVTRNKIAG